MAIVRFLKDAFDFVRKDELILGYLLLILIAIVRKLIILNMGRTGIAP